MSQSDLEQDIFPVELSRRSLLMGAMAVAFASTVSRAIAFGTPHQAKPVNFAKVAKPSSSYVSGDTRLTALNDGYQPENSADGQHGTYGNWPQTKMQWVQYDWAQPITTDKIEVYWWVDGQGIGLPASYRVTYWNGKSFVPVEDAKGLGVVSDQFNCTTFSPVTTDKIRLEITSDGRLSTGILEWNVWSSGPILSFPPVIFAGVDRSVIVGGQTYLDGKADWLDPATATGVAWMKVSGPGKVKFAKTDAPVTTATFSAPGEYVLKIAPRDQKGGKTVRVRVEAPPPKKRLDVVYTRKYSIDSPLWNSRAKALIVNWIPHCIEYCERTDLREGQGGIDNFMEAGKALRGEKHAPHKGYVFANAWVHQTVESMCIALMVDPNGDPSIVAAQERMRAPLEKWIPIILSAQETDGYLQTAYTLADRRYWPNRWSPEHRDNHEGYVAGYFIESAINPFTLTNGKDRRLYDAAKKLADCWVAHIGPGKQEWFDGHQEMEQALVRFGRFVNDVEGHKRGTPYITLAKFLLDSRRGGSEYDQSHLPPARQYEAVGHAVRATYFYSGMADIAAETGDHDYQSAVLSLWDNMVNRKYYLTGGIGSGETSEGFGPNYSLRNEAYCESCSSCGLIFFQYKLNLAYHDAKFADLYEQTMYNALLGATDLDGTTFAYTNPLINTQRTPWHVCPCCVGNIARTLLMIPTWTYVKSDDAIYTNLFIGSKIMVENVAGTDVEMVQKTDYPWDGKVTITVNPKKSKRFSVRVRIPNRSTSELYTELPTVHGYKTFKVNGKAVTPVIEKGYAVVSRDWKAGDTIEVDLPLQPQRVTASPHIKADDGRVALKFGPLVYNVELADQPSLTNSLSAKPIQAEWRPDMLGGVMVLKGEWSDGTPMVAVPNYARMNRVGQSSQKVGGDPSVNYGPGGSSGGNVAQNGERIRRRPRGIESIVWMRNST